MFLFGQVQAAYAYQDKLYRIIEEKDVSAIEWIGDNTPENATVLALPHLSKAITPLSGRRVIALTRTRLGASNQRNADAISFFTGDCEKKRDIIGKYHPDYVFHQAPLSCPFLAEAHRDAGNYIYRVVVVEG